MLGYVCNDQEKFWCQGSIESQFGKGAIMRLGGDKPLEGVSVISTGNIALDLALGVGGVPRGRVVEIFGPEGSGKTTLALHIVAEAQKEGVVAVANHNTEQQIVITGAPGPVEKAAALAAARGGRAIPLKVSGAWHSDLIRDAQDDFDQFLRTVKFAAPQKTLFFNVTADTAADPDEIRQIMARQLCSPVRWYETMNKLVAQEVELFVEVGPGRVLAGLLKKILPAGYPAKIYNIANMKQLEKFITENG